MHALPQSSVALASHAIKGHPFEVVTTVDGAECAVPSDQVKSLQWKVRRVQQKATVSPEVVMHVRARIKALLPTPQTRDGWSRQDDLTAAICNLVRT